MVSKQYLGMLKKRKYFPCYILITILICVYPISTAYSQNRNKLSNSNNLFSFSLYKHLLSQEGNLVLSPYSISTAMQMTLLGSDGDTNSQIASTLRINNQDTLPSNIKSLQNELEKDESVQLNIANSIWINSNYHVNKNYITTIKDNFNSEVHQANFSTQPDSERSKINDWVSNKTNQKITNLLTPGSVTSLTRLILANAIYFLGKWSKEFDPNSTRKSDFFVSSTEKTPADFMSQTSRYFYFEDNQLQMLSMPYAGNAFVMDILLPRSELSSLEQILTADYYDSIQSQLKEKKVTAQIPKFKSELSFNLSDSLSSLGIKDAFQISLANFCKISDNKDLYISDVVHKAFIEVGEKGTEAAAATAVIMRVGSVPPTQEEKPILFRAERPFIHIIRHAPTGTIIFIGRIIRPT